MNRKTVKGEYNSKHGKAPQRPIDFLGKIEAMEDYPDEYVAKGERIGEYAFDLDEYIIEVYKDGKLYGTIK